MSGTYDASLTYSHSGGTYTAFSLTEPALAVGAGGLPVIVVVLTLGTEQWFFSDIEYGDPDPDTGIGRQWHDARVIGDVAYSLSGIPRVMRADRGGGLGAIELDNTDGALDALCMSSESGSVRAWVVEQDQPMSEAMAVAAGTVLRIEGRGERVARIVTGDVRDRLKVPMQRSLYAEGEGAAALVGRPRPVAIGNPLSCPIVLVDDVDYLYDCHESDAHSVVRVRDSGIELLLGSAPGDGYRVATAPGIHGIELLQQPVGRVVADVSATSAAEYELIGTDGDFTAELDTAVWNVTTTGDGTAEWDGIESAALIADGASGAARAEIEWHDTLAAAETYAVSIDVTISSVSGSAGVQVFFRPDSGVPAEYISLGLWTTAGTHSLVAESFVTTGAGHLVIECVAAAGGACSALVDNVRMARIAPGGTIADVIRQLLARAGISEDEIDGASLDALALARPWAVSYWADDTMTVADVLDDVLDSICGYTYTTPEGLIAFGYLDAPEAADAPVVEISSDDLAGPVEIDVDDVKLSGVVAGQRNWQPYGPSELADAIPDADRPTLTATYRVRCTPADPLGIDGSDELVTVLDDAGAVQAQADHLAALWPAGVDRRVLDVPVWLRRTDAAALRPGAKLKLTHDRYGLDAGVPLRVLRCAGRAGEDLIVLRLWGAVETV